MCKECHEYTEYKSFDELPQELKDKYKGRETKQGKDTYVDFINKLNIKGDKLVSNYVNNSTKVLIRYSKCGHEHPEEEGATPNSYKTGYDCGICCGLIVVEGVNDLATTHPKLAKEWHPTKNGDLKPTQLTFGCNKKVWWLGECGHEWEAQINSRRNNTRNCPYCANKKVLRGFNDIVTTHPQYVKYFVNIEDAYTHTYASHDKVKMKCPICGAIKVIDISTLIFRGFSCSKCSDGISYSEKLMASILDKLNVEYSRQLTYDDGKHKYDFYIKDWGINGVISETNGMQHYEQTSRKGARTLEEEQDNDKYKKDDAINNHNIAKEDYHQIDCRYSTLEWCRPNIEKALSNYIDITSLTDKDWQEVDIKAQKSLKVEVCLYWKEQKEINEDLTTAIMAETFKVARQTIINWLTWGNKSELCIYSGEEESKANKRRQTKFIYLIKPDGTKWYDKAMSQNELARLTGITLQAISYRRTNGKPLNGCNAKYDSKYIGCYIVDADEWDTQHN